MSLIEYLEADNWQEVLRRNFEYALELLKSDRFRTTSSSVDDLRSWLACGGVSRVTKHLNDQMDIRRFPAAKKVAVIEFLDQLVRENHHRLSDLTARGILAMPAAPPAVEESESADVSAGTTAAASEKVFSSGYPCETEPRP